MASISDRSTGGQGKRVKLRLSADLRGLRRDRGLTLEAAAAHMQISRAALSLIERDEVTPNAPVAFRVAAFYGLRVTEVWPSETLTEAS